LLPAFIRFATGAEVIDKNLAFGAGDSLDLLDSFLAHRTPGGKNFDLTFGLHTETSFYWIRLSITVVS
jgi:hypothetical protein